MLETFKNYIDSELEFLKDSKLLIAISGGVDSVALTHLCYKSGLDVSLAHCNFNLRGSESDGDEKFIEKLADTWEMELFVQHFDTKDYSAQHKISTQMAARDLRYNWFNELSEQLGFDYILTAHHADDNLETFLINLSRGTGLDGLLGIPMINGKIVRPLLNVSREEIEVYAIENELNWRDDSSNASTKYLRNKLRHDVIPTLKNINTTLLQNFQKTQSQLEDIKSIVNDRIDEVQEKVISKIDEENVYFNIEELLKLNNPKSYIYQLFKDYKFIEFNDIYDLLYSQSGRILYSENYRLIRDRNDLILSLKADGGLKDYYQIKSFEKPFQFKNFTLEFQDAEKIKDDNKAVIFVDSDKLKFPLHLRQWQEGDYFYPFGLNGKKKVSKYFKDEKFSILDKENTWLLCSEDKIVWVIGHRMDDRFKVSDDTQKIMKIELIEE